MTLYEIRCYCRKLDDGANATLERMSYYDVNLMTRSWIARFILPDPLWKFSEIEKARMRADWLRGRLVANNAKRGYGTRIDIVPVNVID